MPKEQSNQKDPMVQPKVNEPEVKPTPSPRVEPSAIPPEMPPMHSER